MAVMVLQSQCPVCDLFDQDRPYLPQDFGGLIFWRMIGNERLYICQQCANKELTPDQLLKVGFQAGFQSCREQHWRATQEIKDPFELPQPPLAFPEDTRSYDVTLEDMGCSKVEIIRQLRVVIPGLSILEARKLAESAPCVIKEGVSEQEAFEVTTKLIAVGARASFK